MVNGETSPPSLLTEADLIALMEKHGIGMEAIFSHLSNVTEFVFTARHSYNAARFL